MGLIQSKQLGDQKAEPGDERYEKERAKLAEHERPDLPYDALHGDLSDGCDHEEHSPHGRCVEPDIERKHHRYPEMEGMDAHSRGYGGKDGVRMTMDAVRSMKQPTTSRRAQTRRRKTYLFPVMPRIPAAIVWGPRGDREDPTEDASHSKRGAGRPPIWRDGFFQGLPDHGKGKCPEDEQADEEGSSPRPHPLPRCVRKMPERMPPRMMRGMPRAKRPSFIALKNFTRGRFLLLHLVAAPGGYEMVENHHEKPEKESGQKAAAKSSAMEVFATDP